MRGGIRHKKIYPPHRNAGKTGRQTPALHHNSCRIWLVLCFRSCSLRIPSFPPWSVREGMAGLKRSREVEQQAECGR